MAYEYEDQCGSCDHLRDKRCDDYLYDTSYYEKGHCTMLGSYFYPDDSNICSHYKNRYRCHVVTVVDEILGKPRNSHVLNTFRGFRANVMEKEPDKYKDMLDEYDIVGPQIAKCIHDDYMETKNNEIANRIYDFFVLPTYYLIKSNKKEEAINKYRNIIKILMEHYGIERVTEVPEDYDYTKGGHGVKKLGTYRGE